MKTNKKYILAIMWTLFVAMCATAIAALCLFVFADTYPDELCSGLALARYIVNVSIPLLGICAMISFIVYRRTVESEELRTHK